MNLLYLYSKIFKKLRGASLLNSFVDKSSKIESGTSFINSKMGKYSFCGYDCEMLNVNIGNYCSIANNVVIGGAMHPMHWVSMSLVFYAGRDSVKKKFAEYQRDEDKPVNIEHDVWIGQYSMIKQGVSIGTGAVIGMGSIVTKKMCLLMKSGQGILLSLSKKDLMTRLLKSYYNLNGGISRTVKWKKLENILTMFLHF